MIIIRHQLYFFSIRKAFNIIDLAIHLDKLENIEICQIALNLVRSYLSERSFKLQLKLTFEKLNFFFEEVQGQLGVSFQAIIIGISSTK